MNTLNRRQFMKLIAATSAAVSIPAIYSSRALASKSAPTGFYDKPMEGEARILHVTDVHGQLLPVYFREPNVNLGVGDAYGRFPHIVGKEFLQANSLEPGSPEEYAFTYLNFAKHAELLGRTGGFAHVKTLLDHLRDQAGGSSNTLTVDGGDLWQGSATSLWTRGVDMVEASNILGIDIGGPLEIYVSRGRYSTSLCLKATSLVKTSVYWKIPYLVMSTHLSSRGSMDADSMTRILATLSSHT